MEFGKDLIGALRDRLGQAAVGAETAAHPDWQMLRTSQSAAWAARRELLAEAALRPERAASFQPQTAALLVAGYDPSRGVNQHALGDGKYPSGNAGDIAVATKVGDRGL